MNIKKTQSFSGSTIRLIIVWVCLAVFPTAFATATPPAAEDVFSLSLEELMDIEVSSAGFFTTSTTKAPGYVMVYDMDEISNSSVRTLGDLMELYVPGAAMGAHERQGRLIGTRGLMIDNNAKTLVMWDGQHINYRTHFGYMVGMLSPFMGDIAKVEVIHGPGAIQHGSGAISGFINMVPKTGTSHPGLFSRYEFGIEETSHLFEGGYGYSYGENKSIYVYGGSYDADGFEPDQDWGYTKSYPENVDAFGFKNSNYRFSTTWNHENFNLNFFVYDLSPQKNNNAEFGYFKNETVGVRPKYVFDLTDTDSIELIGSFLWMDFGEVGGNNWRGDLRGGSEQHWEVKTIYRTTRFDGHQLALGGLYGEKTFRDAEFYFSKTPPEGYESIETEWDEVSLFAEDVIELSDDLTLSMGVRYDEYDTQDFLSKNLFPEPYKPDDMDGHVSPRIALAYQVDKTTSIKASYQHGFRMPDAVYYNWNLYNNAAATSLGYGNSPALKPEEMDSYELNFQKIVDERLTLNTNLYYNIFTDQLSWGPLENYWTDAEVAAINDWTPASSWGWGGGMFQNTEAKSQIYGTEVIADYKLTDTMDLNCSYGFAKANNDEIKQRYPAHQIKTNLMTFFLDNKLMVGLNYLFQSRFTNTLYNSTSDDAMDSAYASDRHVIDLSVVYQPTKNLKFKGIVKNLFGNDTPPSGFRLNEPSWGNMGYSEPRIYVSAEMTF